MVKIDGDDGKKKEIHCTWSIFKREKIVHVFRSIFLLTAHKICKVCFILYLSHQYWSLHFKKTATRMTHNSIKLLLFVCYYMLFFLLQRGNCQIKVKTAWHNILECFVSTST